MTAHAKVIAGSASSIDAEDDPPRQTPPPTGCPFPDRPRGQQQLAVGVSSDDPDRQPRGTPRHLLGIEVMIVVGI